MSKEELNECLQCSTPPQGRKTARITTGGPDVVFDFGDSVMSSVDKTMYENTLNIALNRTCIKDLKMFVLRYFDISVLLEWV